MTVQIFSDLGAVKETIQNNVSNLTYFQMALTLHAAKIVLDETGVIGENELIAMVVNVTQDEMLNVWGTLPIYAQIFAPIVAKNRLDYRAGRRPEDLDDLTFDGIRSSIEKERLG